MKRILREPLLHFLVLGAALFAAYRFMNRAPEAQPAEHVVVSAGQIQHLAERFTQLQQRTATAAELKELIDQYVQEEILSREAVKLGLDRDDVVIRRRLQQKMEFVANDLAAADPPTPAELTEWLAKHHERFRQEPRFSFRHVYLNPEKHGDRLDLDAAEILAQLEQGGPQSSADSLGDSFLLPREYDDVPQSTLATTFGAEFARQLAAAKVGKWSGPVQSGFGMHLVLITSSTESRMPSLEEVSGTVERDLLNERRTEANRRFVEDLLGKYSVTIEWPTEAAASADPRLTKTP